MDRRCRDAVAAVEFGGSKPGRSSCWPSCWPVTPSTGPPAGGGPRPWRPWRGCSRSTRTGVAVGVRGRVGRGRRTSLAVAMRAVSAAWQLGTALRWSTRVVVGGPLSQERRRVTGRHADRAEFDLVQLHRCDPAIRATWIPEALRVARIVLARAEELLAAAQAIWTPSVSTMVVSGWTGSEQMRRIRLRRAVAEVMDTVLATDRLLILDLALTSPGRISSPPPEGPKVSTLVPGRTRVGSSPRRSLSAPDMVRNRRWPGENARRFALLDEQVPRHLL